MSTDKIEATRLADHIRIDQDWCEEAAALLRRWPDAGEPVAWRVGASYFGHYDSIPSALLPPVSNPEPLYTAPPAKPDGEPVAWQRRENDPDERQWVEISKWEYDNCTPHDRRRELFAAPPAESERIAALEAALGELVALKDLKERIEAADASTYSLSDASAAQALADEYDRRKAPAWQAARAALRAIGEVRK